MTWQQSWTRIACGSWSGCSGSSLFWAMSVQPETQVAARLQSHLLANLCQGWTDLAHVLNDPGCAGLTVALLPGISITIEDAALAQLAQTAEVALMTAARRRRCRSSSDRSSPQCSSSSARSS